jgi:hypothetical protein
MIVKVVWCLDADQFEETVPLAYHGEHLAHKGWTNQIRVVFLGGFGLLSSRYRSYLQELGYHLIDGESLFQHHLRQRPGLWKWPSTCQMWMLRWAVIHDLVNSSQLQLPIIHLDGDIVLMQSPEEIAEDVRGKTFILHGSPAFASIQDNSWFHQWEEGLAAFLESSKATMDRSASVKANPSCPDWEYGNQCVFSSDRAWHDQDLMEMLIAEGKLHQDKASKTSGSRYYWINNPLYPSKWCSMQGVHSADAFTASAHEITASQRTVPFMHFQGDAIQVMRWWLHARGMLRGIFPPFHPAHPAHQKTWPCRIARALQKVRPTCRLSVYKNILGPSNAVSYELLSEFIRDCWKLCGGEDAQ